MSILPTMIPTKAFDFEFNVFEVVIAFMEQPS